MKRYPLLSALVCWVVFVSGLHLPAATPSGCVAPPDGLVGWWRGEGTARDELGLDHGEASGNLGYAQGMVDQAFLFDGTNAAIQISASSNVDVGRGDGFTIEAWVNPYLTDISLPIIEWNSGSALGVYLWTATGNGLQANIMDTQGQYHWMESQGAPLVTNQWQHVALTYDKPSGQCALYLNGQLQAQQNLGSVRPQTTYDLYLGYRPSGGWSQVWDGAIDEVSLYSRALVAEEINAVYKAQSNGKCTGPSAPTIWLQPTNQTATVGDAVLFTAEAWGSQPRFYQWLKDGVLLTNSDKIIGAQTPVLTLSNVLGSAAGAYWVVVSNALGCATSSVGLLTVADPVIVSQPTNIIVNVGQSGALSVQAAGQNPLSYQWRKGGVLLAGATAPILCLTNAQADLTGLYDVVVTGPFGSTTSQIATVTVNTGPADSFNPAADNVVFALAPEENGQILIGGNFQHVGEALSPCFAQVNANGAINRSFKASVDGWVNCLANQSDGKTLVGGYYSTLNGVYCGGFGRLSPDGTVDTNFISNSQRAIASHGVSCITLQPDGKILAAGSFWNNNGFQQPTLARFCKDGTTDPTFNCRIQLHVLSVVVQPDGKILIAGDYYNNVPTYFEGSRVVRLNTDGSADPAFTPQYIGPIYCLALQHDGKLLVGGMNSNMRDPSATNYMGLARFNPDGSWDTDFFGEDWMEVHSLALQANGKVIVAGAEGFDVNDRPPNSLYELSGEGIKDLSFYPGTDQEAYSIALQPDGKLLVGGFFQTLNGQSRSCIGRVGMPDAAAHALIVAGSRVEWLIGGSCPEPAWTVFQSSVDGTNWTNLGLGTPMAGGWQLATPLLPRNGFVRAQGLVTGGFQNGSCWFLEDIAATSPNASRPKLVIAAPAPAERLTNDAVIAAGLVSSADGVASVWYQLNGSEWRQVAGTTNWSIGLTPLAGANTLKVFAVDPHGVASLPASVTFTQVQSSVLTVTTNGSGSVSPNENGRPLEIGKTYCVTARPKAGWIFAGWSGGLSNGSPALTFAMQSNLVLQANFITNPFPALAGLYNGLIDDLGGVAAESSGCVSLSVTRSGAFSGTLQLGTGRYGFSGQFDAQGAAARAIARHQQGSLTVALQLDLKAAAISGSVSSGGWTATLSADHAYPGAVPQAGRYTLMFQGDYMPVTEPCGHGYGTVLVDKSGRINLAGALADGTRFSQAAVLTASSQWPLYVPLYRGAGLLLSWLAFDEGISGDVDWLKPGLAREKYFTNGFAMQTVAWGSTYVPPSGKTNVLGFEQGTLLLKAADAMQASTQDIQLGSFNRISFPTTLRGSLYFTPLTGLFQGSVVDPQTERLVPVQGVVLQNWNLGCGYFLTPQENGAVVFGDSLQMATNPPGWKP